MDGEASGHGCEITSLRYSSIEAKVYRCHGRPPTTNLDPILHESVGCILTQLSHAGMLWASTGQPLVLIMYFYDISPTTLDGRGWPSVTCCMGMLQ